MAITAFTGEDLQAAGVTRFEDFAVRVPNLSFGNNGEGISRSRNIAIRGIIGGNTTGFYIDDTPMEESMTPVILDVERVEVLRGPQGTLYGARSMGGTVRLVTKKPRLDASEYNLHAIVGSTADAGTNYTFDGSVNIPLVDNTLGLRLAAYYQSREGTHDRVHSNYSPVPGVEFETPEFDTVKNVDDQEVNGAQAALRWAASDWLTFDARINYQDLHGDGLPYADNDPDNTIHYRAFDLPETYDDEFTQIVLGFDADVAKGSLVGSFSTWERDTYDSEDISEFISWIPAFAGVDGFLPPLSTRWERWLDTESDVAELRFLSDFDGPVQAVVGAYYSKSRQKVQYYNKTEGFDDAWLETFGWPIGVNDLLFDFDGRTTVEEKALFGEMTWSVSEQFAVILGLRWFDTEIDNREDSSGLVGGGEFVGDQSEDGTNPKFAVEYRPKDDRMYYFSAAQGYRIGGVNTIPLEFCYDSFVEIGVPDPGSASSYDSDSLWNYEIGMKNTYSGGRFQLNGALFLIDWSDIQQSQVLSCGFGFTLNAGAAESKGVELEGSLMITDNLLWTFGVGYLDAEITEAGILTSPIAQPGMPLQHVPEWTGSTTLDYGFPMGGNIDGNLRIDVSYTGDSISFRNRITNPTLREALTLVNVRLSAVRDNWNVTLFADNLFDEREAYGDNRSLAAELPGRPRLAINQGRTIGLDLRYRY